MSREEQLKKHMKGTEKTYNNVDTDVYSATLDFSTITNDSNDNTAIQMINNIEEKKELEIEHLKIHILEKIDNIIVAMNANTSSEDLKVITTLYDIYMKI